MENEKKLGFKKKNALITIGVVIVLAVVIALIASAPKDKIPGEEGGVTTPNQEQVTPGEGGAGEEGTIPEEGDMEAIGAGEANPVLVGAVTQAPGADLITTEGKVVNQGGEAVRTDVAYNSPEAPKQTQVIEEEDIPEATKLTLGSNGFEPKEFRIAAGAALTVALTGSEDSSHVLAFESPLLSGVYINVRPGETRATTFNVPNEPGEYVFFCDLPGHRNKGETGVMIVE